MSWPRIILAMLIVAALAFAVIHAFSGLAVETILKSASSPDGKMIAQVTNFDHGAMTASLITITVGSKDEKAHDRDVMFAVDGMCKVDNLAWVNDKKLHVDYDCPPGMIELAILKKDGITMEYAQEPLPPIHSSFVP